MSNSIKERLIVELDKVPEGMRYIDASNYKKIEELLKEGTPYKRATEDDVKKLVEKALDSLVVSYHNLKQIQRAFENFTDQSSKLEGTPIYLRKPVLTPIVSPRSTCNRHNDCHEADKIWLTNHPTEKWVPVNFHCHNDECEDCFGC